MSRLTTRTENGKAYLVNVKPDEQEVDSPYKNTLQCVLDCFERLAQYEDLEEQGRLVVLPCKVGTPVWSTVFAKICQTESGEYYEEPTQWPFAVSMMDDLGKGWHLTRAEAEAALQKEAQHE